MEKLGIEPQEAEEIACRFEHVTPEELADRLATFLENPVVSPQNAPIPYGRGASVKHPTRPLTSLAAGLRGHRQFAHGEVPAQDY